MLLVDRRAGRLLCLRLAPHRGVFLEIPPGEIGHRWPAGGLLRLERRFIARLDPGDDLGRPLARLLGMDHPVPADGHAPGSLRPTRLGDVDLRSRGIDPDAEAGEFPVPEHGLFFDLELADLAVRERPVLQLRHILSFLVALTHTREVRD